MERERPAPGEGRGGPEAGERSDAADPAEQLTWRTGFEVELLAPRGASRRDLAEALARSCGGSIHAVWHHASEPAPVASLGGRFLHLTQGFAVTRANGEPLCTVVDDITISADLDPQAAAPDGWLRVLTDDVRLLELLSRCCDPSEPLDDVLNGVASVFGGGSAGRQVERIGNVRRLDVLGATVAMAMPAGGERERPCEIVTPPIDADHRARLAELLAPARELGFTVPQEAAVHVHVDGAPFRSAPALANLVRLFALWREHLHVAFATNPRCRRLAPLPDPLVQAVAGRPSVTDLRAAAKAGGLTKFFDVNLVQVLSDTPMRDTVEVRILPGSIDADEIVSQAALVQRLLSRCLDPEPVLPPESHDEPLP